MTEWVHSTTRSERIGSRQSTAVVKWHYIRIAPSRTEWSNLSYQVYGVCHAAIWLPWPRPHPLLSYNDDGFRAMYSNLQSLMAWRKVLSMASGFCGYRAWSWVLKNSLFQSFQSTQDARTALSPIWCSCRLSTNVWTKSGCITSPWWYEWYTEVKFAITCRTWIRVDFWEILIWESARS